MFKKPSASLAAASIGFAAALAGCTVNVGVPAGTPAGQPANTRSAEPSPASARAGVAPSTAPAETREPAAPSTSAKPKARARSSTAKGRAEQATPKKRIRLGDVDTSPDAGLAWIVEGTRGEGARCVQHALNVVNDAQLSVDGYFGPVSRRALKAFQRSISISDDGEVGPATGHWLALYYDYVQGTGSWARTGCYGYVPARRS